jgi:hypothetical protein
VFDLSSGHDQTAGPGLAAREDGPLTLFVRAPADPAPAHVAPAPSFGRSHMTIMTLADALAADDKVARSAGCAIPPAGLAEKPRLKRVLFACEAASDPGQFTTRPN